MIFDRIASGLTKHYKVVLVIWIVALLISVPAILQVNSVINYQQTEGATGNFESVKGSGYYHRPTFSNPWPTAHS